MPQNIGRELSGDQINIIVKLIFPHRCAVRVRGPSLSDKITNTDPLKDMYYFSFPT